MRVALPIFWTSSRFASQLLIWLLLIGGACLEPYPPPPGTENLNLLVVDGFLNSTNGVAQVKLSRTVPIDGGTIYPTEFGALIQVEDENGARFTITEVSVGLYRTVRNDLKVGKRYRLLIRTRAGDTYESDPVLLKESPILESVFWEPEGDGITIKLDARDPSGTTRYYQWLYTEVWSYNANKASGFIMSNGTALPRSDEQKIDICYSSKESSRVLISTTSDQSGDFINDYALTHITAGSKKISGTYSINVQQRALDEESYNYWLQLQRTNENLGGLFDPLPSQVMGNIHSTTQGIKEVLGFFSGGGVEEKRIYIDFFDLPENIRFVTAPYCPVDSVLIRDLRMYPDGYPVLGPYFNGGVAPIGYTFSTVACSDCRSEGGSVTKPPFWPR